MSIVNNFSITIKKQTSWQAHPKDPLGQDSKKPKR